MKNLEKLKLKKFREMKDSELKQITGGNDGSCNGRGALECSGHVCYNGQCHYDSRYGCIC